MELDASFILCPTKAIKLQNGKNESFWTVDPKKIS